MTVARSAASKLRRRVRAIPLTVWLVVGVHVASMGAYSLLYIPYTNPDEAQHHDMVIAWSQGEGLAGPGERFMVEGVGEGYRSSMISFYFPPYGDVSGDAGFPPRGERPTFEELGGTGEFDPTGFPGGGSRAPNALTQHPPLYYASLHAVRWLNPFDDDLAWDQSMWLLRGVNIVIMAPLPVLAWAAARRLRARPIVATGAAALVLAVPGVTRLGSSINNDNLLVLLTGILTVQAIGLAKGIPPGREGTKRLVAAGVTCGLALLTKGFALAFIPVLGLAAVLGARRVGASWVRAGAIALGTAFVAGGWWWLRNLVVHGTVQPNGLGDFPLTALFGPDAPDDLPRNLTDFVDGYIGQLSRHLVVTLGLLEPPVFNFRLTMLVLLTLGIGAGIALVRRPRTGELRPRRLILAVTVLLPTIGVTAILSKGVYAHWQRWLTFQATQGRYFYPLLVGLAAAAAVGWACVTGRFRRWLPLAFLGIAVVVQLWAIKTQVDHFWAPRQAPSRRDALGDATQALVDRSPWPVGLTALPFLLGAVLWPVTIAAAAIAGRRDEDDQARSEASAS